MHCPCMHVEPKQCIPIYTRQRASWSESLNQAALSDFCNTASQYTSEGRPYPKQQPRQSIHFAPSDPHSTVYPMPQSNEEPVSSNLLGKGKSKDIKLTEHTELVNDKRKVLGSNEFSFNCRGGGGNSTSLARLLPLSYVTEKMLGARKLKYLMSHQLSVWNILTLGFDLRDRVGLL